MKERPILFSGPMVRAILEGRKTQTRRVVKDLVFTPDFIELGNGARAKYYGNESHFKRGASIDFQPYGKIGDRLWVRETWKHKGHSFPIGHPYEYRATAESDGTPTEGPWKPSIFMPRDACRIMLEITDVRVERLQDISEKDAISEGIESVGENWRCYATRSKNAVYPKDKPISSYLTLWASINGWDSLNANPYVWVIQFKIIEP